MLARFAAVHGRPVEARVDEAQVVAQLVRRCSAGDAAAWEELVGRFHRRIYNICYRFAGTCPASALEHREVAGCVRDQSVPP